MTEYDQRLPTILPEWVDVVRIFLSCLAIPSDAGIVTLQSTHSHKTTDVELQLNKMIFNIIPVSFHLHSFSMQSAFAEIAL